MVYATTAAEILGITLRTFKQLDIEATDSAVNPHYRSGAECYLYNPCDLEQLVDDPRVLAGRARRARKPKDHSAKFRTRYATPGEAIPDAAEAMWNLNRYAAHDTCSEAHRKEIYDLKNSFVQFLCKVGLLVGVGAHKIEQSEKVLECHGCNGTGDSCDYWPDSDEDYDEWSDSCQRCDGTGIYLTLPRRTLVFSVFRFRIGMKVYTWHQPDELVTWDVPEPGCLPESCCIGDDYVGKNEDAPIEIKAAKFAEAKALIRWACNQVMETSSG